MREEKKKKRKRILSVVLAVTMGMSMLTGCGASENSQSAETVELKGEYQASPFVQAEINSDTVEWICAAYAVYTQYNHKTLGVIGGLSDQEKESSQDRIKLTLSEGWGINGRDDVTEVINKLLTKGHRETYLKTVKKLEKKGLLELSTEEAMTNFSEDDEEFARYQDAHEMYTQYGEHGMDGWDYSRALQVLGDCYLADYINLEECLDLSLPIAKKLQSAFTSWEELADSYIYGYAFWQNETADDVETKFRIQAYAELVEMENSPYSVAYDTKLENTWKDGEKRKEERKAYEMSDGYVPTDVQIQKVFRYVFRKNMCLTKKIMKSMKIPNLPNHVGMETASISVIRQNFWMTGTMQNCKKNIGQKEMHKRRKMQKRRAVLMKQGKSSHFPSRKTSPFFILLKKR